MDIAGTIDAVDRDTARKITERCSTSDFEGNGSELDRIIIETLRCFGMNETVAAIEAVHCWRA